MHRIAKALFAVMGVLVLTAQLVNPRSRAHEEIRHRTVWDDPTVTPEVKTVLARSCGDCHSDRTRWPWYGRVAPVSWILIWDIDHARQKLDLSDWSLHSKNEAQEIGDAIANGSMPPRRYRLLHPASTLSAQDRATIDRWIEK